jgi:tetratricopeptide (TPR) repeat protein
MSLLRDNLVQYFDENELVELCADLTVPYDSLPGKGGTREKARELILLFQRSRRPQVPHLLEVLRQKRPLVDWQWAEPDIALLEAEADGEARRLAQAIQKSLLLKFLLGVGVLGIAGVAAVLFGVNRITDPCRNRMGAGGKAFNIAVSTFKAGKPGITSSQQDRISARVFGEISKDLSSDAEVWRPGCVGVAGTEDEADAVASRVNANVVIYGLLESDGTDILISPRFYVSPGLTKDFSQADEAITGEQSLGAPIRIRQNEVADLDDAAGQFMIRMRALSGIIRGVSSYSRRDVKGYEQALLRFDEIETLPGWNDADGKQVLYQLIGASHAKLYERDLSRPAGHLAQALAAYSKAIAIDPDYARAFHGLAGVHYLKAIRPVALSGTNDFTQVDQPELDLAFTHYTSATHASNQSKIADLPTRIKFGLGQCNMLRAQSDPSQPFDEAIELFEGVIQHYEQTTDINAKARLKILAAESHARLGAIYAYFSEHHAESIENYDAAIQMSAGREDRLAVFRRELDAVKAEPSKP